MNVIEIATGSSFRLALRVSRIHYNALQANIADAVVLALYNAYKPFHLAYLAKYGAWKAQLGIQKGLTAALYEMFAQLGFEKINAWDVAIASVYAKGTVRYQQMFPNGHGPFQHGTQDEKVEAINSLSIAIGADVALAAVKLDVDNFYIAITLAVDTQKTSIETTKVKSNELEAARVEMCDAQYVDLGSLMAHYVSNKVFIGTFFDLLTIRNITQMVFQHAVKKEAVHTVVERTIEATDQLEIENDGVTELRIYLSDVRDGAIGAMFIIVPAGGHITVLASDLGDVTTQHFLMVFNPDTINKGEFTIDFL